MSTPFTKDVQILRQSQSKLALEYVSSIGVKLSVFELQKVTDVLVEICHRPMDDDLKKRIKNLDKWLETKSQNKPK